MGRGKLHDCLLWLLILILLQYVDCSKKGSSRDPSTGSGRLIARFDKLYNGFQQLREDVIKIKNRKKDPTSHLKASNSNCHFKDDCSINFLHDNTTSVFNWNRQSLHSENSFPNLGTGDHLMVAKVEKYFKRNQHAIMTTEIPVKVDQQCVDFYYFMFSQDGCDSVRFSVTLKCEGHPDEIIIKTSGSRTKEWHYVQFDVNKPLGTKCHVHWRAAKGLSEEGKVGIDDVSIHYEPCPTYGRVFPKRLSCAFNEDLCLWRAVGQLRWKNEILPAANHFESKQNLHFIQINNSEVNPQTNKEGILLSPLTFHTGPKCLSFKWALLGREPGNFTVSFITKNETQLAWVDDYYEFQKRGLLMKTDGGPLLSKELIELPQNQEYKVEFKFRSGSREIYYSIFLSDVAILEDECEVHKDPMMYNKQKRFKYALNAPTLKRKQTTDDSQTSRKTSGDGLYNDIIIKTEELETKVKTSTCVESYFVIVVISYLFVTKFQK